MQQVRFEHWSSWRRWRFGHVMARSCLRRGNEARYPGSGDYRDGLEAEEWLRRIVRHGGVLVWQVAEGSTRGWDETG